MITESEYTRAKEVVSKYEKQQLEIKALRETPRISIIIEGCLLESGKIVFWPLTKDGRINIKREGERFSSITKLKQYYGIKKTTKTGEIQWAISPRGKKYEWPVLEAEISSDFIL